MPLNQVVRGAHTAAVYTAVYELVNAVKRNVYTFANGRHNLYTARGAAKVIQSQGNY